MIQGTKVVTSEEMQRLEKLSFKTGRSAEELMDQAAASIVSVINQWFELSQSPPEVVLLVGKGNNGGDALTVGTLLLKQKVRVSAILVYSNSELSPLCKTRLKQYQKSGGKLQAFKETRASLIVDGIVGTGFHGAPDEQMRQAIEWAHAQDAAILAIDLPSGLDGTTGSAGSIAIHATITCCLGLPKIGCFIGQGWDHSGTLLTCDIDLPDEVTVEAQASALLLKPSSLYLPPLVRTRHKYEAGYIVEVAGSYAMPGAAALSSLAALRSGAGIIRVFTQEDTPRSSFAPEVICETIDVTRIAEELKRADAVLIGPGLGRSSSAQKITQKLLPLLGKPTVIDGDGLYHLSQLSKLPTNCILTPHHGEMKRLLGDSPTLENCQKWVAKHRVTLVLKGAPTIIFHPTRRPLIITAGDPGMATAGSGDVLAGMITAFLAQKMPADYAAALAVYLHGRAGEIAAGNLSSYCLVASDLIAHLPAAFKELIDS